MDWGTESPSACFPTVVKRSLKAENINEVADLRPVPEWTFADEIMAEALLELSAGRKGASTIFAAMALESSARRALRAVFAAQLPGFSRDNILRSVARDVGTASLVRLLHEFMLLAHGEDPESIGRASNLFNLRNTVTHRGQRRFPSFVELRDRLLQVQGLVRRIQVLERRTVERTASARESPESSDPDSPSME